MKAPITPPSKRIVRPGPWSRWAKVAASSGMPTPANTTCPSFNWRALRTASSSLAVYADLCVIDRRSRPRGLQDLVDPDEIEKRGPGFRPVHEPIEIFVHPGDRIVVYEVDVILHVSHHRLVDAVALMWRGPEWQFDHRVDSEEGNFCLIRRTADLIIGHEAFGSQDHLVGRHRQIDIHELQSTNLRVPICIATLDMNKRHIWVERRYEQKLLAGERADHFLGFGPLIDDGRTQHRAYGNKWHAHGASAEAHSHRHMAPLVVSRLAGFHVVAHHL